MILGLEDLRKCFIEEDMSSVKVTKEFQRILVK